MPDIGNRASILSFFSNKSPPPTCGYTAQCSFNSGSSGFSVGGRIGCGSGRCEHFGLAKGGRERGTSLLAPSGTLLLVPSGDPTPATRPSGRTLLEIGGPCLSAASWLALLLVASVQSVETGGASLVLGPFANTKGPRLPGRNPATP